MGRGQLPTLDLVHERFAAFMADTFSRLTGQPASALCMPAEPIKFVEGSSALSSPVCIEVLDLTGLRGTGVFTVDPSLLFHIIDLLLGGCPTKVVDASEILRRRGMTGVERRLFDHIVRTLGKDLTKRWDGVAPLTALMRGVTVQVTAELGSSTLSLRDLMALKVGDVVRLDPDPEGPIVLFVEGTAKLIGTPTLSRGNTSTSAPARSCPSK